MAKKETSSASSSGSSSSGSSSSSKSSGSSSSSVVNNLLSTVASKSSGSSSSASSSKSYSGNYTGYVGKGSSVATKSGGSVNISRYSTNSYFDSGSSGSSAVKNPLSTQYSTWVGKVVSDGASTASSIKATSNRKNSSYLSSAIGEKMSFSPLTTQYNNTVGKVSKDSGESTKEENKGYLAKAMDTLAERFKSWAANTDENLKISNEVNSTASNATRNTIKSGVKSASAGTLNAITTLANAYNAAQRQQAAANTLATAAVQNTLNGNSNAAGTDPTASAQAESARSQRATDEFRKYYNIANALNSTAANDAQRAKDLLGNTTVGNVLVDLGRTGVEMATDAPLNLIAPGAGLFTMGLRSFGSGASEARQDGANLLQQLTYGTGKAAVEVLTEKLGNGLAGLYGKGAADEVVESLITKLAKTEAGQAALRMLINAFEEGGEEALSDVADPFLKAIYDNGEAIKGIATDKDTRNEYLANMGYDALLGGIFGAIGGAVESVKGRTIADTLSTETNENVSAEAKAVLESIIDNTEEGYKKAGTQIVSNPEVLTMYEQKFGPVQGTSNTEKANNIANALREADRQAEAEAAKKVPPKTLEGAEHPMSMPSQVEDTTHPMAQSTQEGPNPDTEGQIGAVMQIREMQKGGISYSDATKIIADPVLRRAFEDMYGITLSDNRSVAKEQIVEAGKSTPAETTSPITFDENNSPYEHEGEHVKTETAKRQWGAHQNSGIYPKTHNKPNPLVSDNGTHKQEEPYTGAHSAPTVETTVENSVPEYTLRGNNASKTAKTENAPKTQNKATTSTQEESGKNTQSEKEEPAETVKPRVSAKAEQNEHVEKKYSGNPSKPDTAKTQNSIAEDTFNEEEYEATGGETEHTVQHDEDVYSQVQERIDKHPDTVKANLLTHKKYSVEDVVASNIMIKDVTEKVRNAKTPEEKAEALKELAELRSAREKGIREDARALRQAGNFDYEPDDIISSAANTLYGEDSAKTTKGMTDEEKVEVVNEITSFANEIKEAGNDTSKLIDIISRLSARRNTGNIFTGKLSKPMVKYLNTIAGQKGGAEFLKAVAATQAKRIATDYARPTALSAISTIRYNNMLSKFVTTATNLLNNGIMDPMETLSNNIGVLLGVDKLLSKITGSRSSGFERLTGEQGKAAKKAGQAAWMRSVIQVGLDAEIDSDSRYSDSDEHFKTGDEFGGRTFKMSGSPLSKAMSLMTKYLNYALVSTDEMKKGEVRARTQYTVNKLVESGKASEDFTANRADEEAKIRTLQNNGKAAKTAIGIRNLANNIGIPTKNGKVGLGDVEVPFAKVGANAIGTSVSYTPIGGLVNTISSIADFVGKKWGLENTPLTAQEQANIVKAVGRTATGSAVVSLATIAALHGLIKRTDDDDKDKAAAQKNEMGGNVQFNLSALARLFGDDHDTEWRNDDITIDASRIDFLNCALSMGELIADDMNSAVSEDGKSFGEMFKSVAEDNFKAAFDTFQNFPALSNVTGVIDAYNYSKADTTGGKVLDAATYNLGTTASSFLVPNWLRGIATGTDKYQRDIYSSTAEQPLIRSAENAWNYIKSGVPGLRETLPIAKDTFGEEKTTGSPLLNFISKNVSPFAINEYKQSELSKDLERLSADYPDLNLYPERTTPSTIRIGEENVALSADNQKLYSDTYTSALTTADEKFRTSEMYENMTENERAIAYDRNQSLAKELAQIEVLKAIGTDEALETAQKKADYDIYYGNEEKGTKGIGDKIYDYYAYKDSFDNNLEDRDYSSMDKFVAGFDDIDRDIKDTLFAHDADIKHLVNVADSGMDSKQYLSYRDELDSIATEKGISTESGIAKLYALGRADIDDDTLERVVNDNALDLSATALACIEVLCGEEHHFSIEQAADFFYEADKTFNIKYENEQLLNIGLKSTDAEIRRFAKAIDNTDYGDDADAKQADYDLLRGLIVANDISIDSVDGGDSGGTLSQLEVTQWLKNAELENTLEEDEATAIYNELKELLSNQNNTWYNYSYSNEKKYLEKQEKKGWTFGRSSRLNRVVTTTATKTSGGRRGGKKKSYGNYVKVPTASWTPTNYLSQSSRRKRTKRGSTNYLSEAVNNVTKK